VARIIAVVGTKGGSGKTTTAHALGHGFGSLPQPISCIVVTTDEGTPVPNRENRRYIPADGTTGEGLKRVLSPVMDRDDVLVVIDGAARRTGADEAVTRMADLVIVPLDPSPQALEWALRDTPFRVIVGAPALMDEQGSCWGWLGLVFGSGAV